jgi:hypothetical protein
MQIDARNISKTKSNILLNYNKKHGTSLLKKQVSNGHLEESKRQGLFLIHIVIEMVKWKQVAKKRKIILPFQIMKFFCN